LKHDNCAATVKVIFKPGEDAEYGPRQRQLHATAAAPHRLTERPYNAAPNPNRGISIGNYDYGPDDRDKRQFFSFLFLFTAVAEFRTTTGAARRSGDEQRFYCRRPFTGHRRARKSAGGSTVGQFAKINCFGLLDNNL
jgi:hypothetical protein